MHDNSPFITKPVPIESPQSKLSIGICFVTKGWLSEKLWGVKVYKQFFRGIEKTISTRTTTTPTVEYSDFCHYVLRLSLSSTVVHIFQITLLSS